MAQIGLRYPVYAPLTEDETAGMFTYGAGKVAGKAITVNSNLNIANSKLFADDNVAESVKEFSDGTITFGADDLDSAVKSDWLGNKVETVTISEESVEVLSSSDTDTPGLFGFGFILPKIKNKQRMYRAIIYTKVQFGEPNETAETKGEQIVWQTPSIEGSLMRRIDGQWKKEITVSSLATAKAWLAQELNIGV